jgi:hypothetical protein
VERANCRRPELNTKLSNLVDVSGSLGLPLEHMADQNFKNSGKMPSPGFSPPKLQKKGPAAENYFGRGLEKLQTPWRQTYKQFNPSS